MVTFPSVLPPVLIVCCVVEVEINAMAEVAALPNVYVQPEDGKIVLLINDGDRTVLARFLSDGTKDTTFGKDGRIL